LDLAPGFNPAMGLVARPGTRRLEASGTLPWFPGNTSPVRRFAPGLSFVRYDDHGGRGFEERVGISFATAWKNDCRSRGELTRQREHLAAPFRIYRDIVVEPGDYARWEWAASGATDPTRELSAEAELRMGGLFGGNHRAAGLALSWQPNRFLVVSSAWTGDHVELPQARFLAWVARARIGLTASPRLRLDLLGQYESERRGTGIGFRFRFDFREGTQLLLAWDSVEIRRPLGSPVLHGERVQRGAIRGSYLLLF
jgi:hypothetical protein